MQLVNRHEEKLPGMTLLTNRSSMERNYADNLIFRSSGQHQHGVQIRDNDMIYSMLGHNMDMVAGQQTLTMGRLLSE